MNLAETKEGETTDAAVLVVENVGRVEPAGRVGVDANGVEEATGAFSVEPFEELIVVAGQRAGNNLRRRVGGLDCRVRGLQQRRVGGRARRRSMPKFRLVGFVPDLPRLNAPLVALGEPADEAGVLGRVARRRQNVACAAGPVWRADDRQRDLLICRVGARKPRQCPKAPLDLLKKDRSQYFAQTKAKAVALLESLSDARWTLGLAKSGVDQVSMGRRRPVERR